MGSGATQQGGIMGQLNDRMNSSDPMKRHIAGMMQPIFQRFADSDVGGVPGAFMNRALYGNQPPAAPAMPVAQPQGIVSALPANPEVPSRIYP